MSIKTYNVKLNWKVYEVEIEEVKASQQPTMSATPQAAPASAPNRFRTSCRSTATRKHVQHIS